MNEMNGIRGWTDASNCLEPPIAGATLTNSYSRGVEPMSVSFTRLSYHFIWSTKDRMDLMKPSLQPRLYSYLGTIVQDLNGTPVRINGTQNHVHLLVQLHPSTAPSDVVKRLKSNASRWINEQFPDLSKFQWQEGYAAFTVSESVMPDLKTYIRNQEQHHRNTTFREEYRKFLERHGIDSSEDHIL